MGKRIRYTAKEVESMSDNVEETPNCGISMAIGLDNAHTVTELTALRRAANWAFNSSQVLAVSTQREAKLASKLRKAGFKKSTTFDNVRTMNTLTLWTAKTLRHGGARVEEGLEGRW